MGETSLERCLLKHYHEVLSQDWFVSTWWTNQGQPFWRRGTCQPENYNGSNMCWMPCGGVCFLWWWYHNQCASLINPSNPNWREEVRRELLHDHLDVQLVSKDTSIDDDYDKELEEPSIKSLAEALRITDQLRHFAQFNGYQDLALAVGKTNDVISSLQLRTPKQQNSIDGLF